MKVGHAIAGRFTVTEHLAGHPAWGVFRATDRDGAACLVTVASPPRDAEALAAALALPAVPGLAELRFHGLVTEDGPHVYVVVEREPAGAPLVAPVAVGAAAALGAGLARVLAAAHAADRALGGVHPRVVYADGGALAGLAPRYAALLAATGGEWKPPLFEPTFAAPELLQGDGRAPAPTADVFALCAILAWLVTGRPPFGATAVEEHRAHFRAPPALPDVPAPLREAVHAGLARDPFARPTAAALAAALSRVAG